MHPIPSCISRPAFCYPHDVRPSKTDLEAGGRSKSARGTGGGNPSPFCQCHARYVIIHRRAVTTCFYYSKILTSAHPRCLKPHLLKYPAVYLKSTLYVSHANTFSHPMKAPKVSRSLTCPCVQFAFDLSERETVCVQRYVS